MNITFDNSYARLPPQFFVRLPPAEAPAPAMLRLNHALAGHLGLDASALDGPAGAQILSGKAPPKGAEPLAMAYAGHQFGNWVPQLGDGRAVLLGEVLAPDGSRFDIHLKGSGRTPFSRGGDGKAVLGAVLREYIISEAMQALGIPTTRALAAVTTGEQVMRDGYEPGAVLARVAASHVRVGTFQYFYARQDHDALQSLLDHVIARHYPQSATAEIPALTVLNAVLNRQADLVAHWMSVGFIHGVMNTDNMSIAGETIDYGPCAFMDAFRADQVFSSIDRQGRYAWSNQPRAAHWNLAQFAQSLLPLIPGEAQEAARLAQDVLDRFGPAFETAYRQRFAAKIGLGGETDSDMQLVSELLGRMEAGGVDFTLAFHHLTTALETGDAGGFRALFAEPPDNWLADWRKQAENSGAALPRMQTANPVYIARNHRVEAALRAADTGDLDPFETLLKVIEQPFSARAAYAAFEAPPRPDEQVHQTFCGT